MSTCTQTSVPPQRLKKLLARALDPAAHPGEAEIAATIMVRHARRESLTVESFAEAIAPARQLPSPSASEPIAPPACSIVMRFGKHRGKSLGQIAHEDIGYLRWLAGGEFMDVDLPAAAGSVLAYVTGRAAA